MGAKLPPAQLYAYEVDPPHDDCERYALKLQAAGGTASWRVYPGLLHGTPRASAPCCRSPANGTWIRCARCGRYRAQRRQAPRARSVI
jgi:acetyl esterase/lipase